MTNDKYYHRVIIPVAMIVLPLVVLLIISVVFKLEPLNSAVSSQQNDVNVEAEWEKFWTLAMKDSSDDTSTPLNICTQNQGIKPGGDTWFMRHLKKFPSPPTQVQRTFVAVAISNDPEQRQSKLKPLTKNSDALIRYRAHLEIARSIMRKNQADSIIEAFPAIQAALTISLTEESMKADAYFLKGLYYSHQLNITKAKLNIQKSIELDPCFFDARSSYVETLLKDFAMTPRSLKIYPACLTMVLELLDNLYWIGNKLVDDQRLYIEMANRLARHPHNSEVYHFALGFVQFKASDYAKANKSFQTVLDFNSQLPKTCHIKLKNKAIELLTIVKQSSAKPL